MAIRVFSTSTLTEQTKYPTFAGDLVLGVGFGYAAGGYNGTIFSAIGKFDFAAKSWSTLGASLPDGTHNTSGMGSATAGYTLGGLNSSNNLTSNVYKLTFSTETTSTLASGLSAARRLAAGGVESSTDGYAPGGLEASRVTTIDKFDFSTDARSTLAATLSHARDFSGGFSSEVAGYVVGGNDSSGSTPEVDKLTFSTDTVAALTNLPSGNVGSAGFQSASYGYVAGGNTGGTKQDSIQRWDFSDDSRTTLAATIPTAVDGARALSGTSAGYIVGGTDGAIFINTTTELDFSTETTSAAGNYISTVERVAAFEGQSGWA